MIRSKEGSGSDYPPFSRLFVICGNNVDNLNLRYHFSKFGEVEEISIPRHHNTNQVKGIAYIKFAKTSQAANAQSKLNRARIPGCPRPLKVVVATSRSNIQDDQFEEMSKRLFITCSKNETEDTLYEHFKQFGKIVTVVIQRDRATGTPKGFAYISYSRFTESARAFEEADKVYNAVFAKPKEKPALSFIENNITALANSYTGTEDGQSEAVALTQAMNVKPEGYTRVCAVCSNHLPPSLVEGLFGLVPGMLHFQYTRDLLYNCPKIYITYSNPTSAKYAVLKLNEFEFPPGEYFHVKPDRSDTFISKTKTEIPNAINNLKMAMSAAASTSHPDLKELVEAIAKASSLVKSATTGDKRADIEDLNYCSATLPPQKPLANVDSPIAKRCFLVLAPHPPPQTVLQDVFCRFGDLIEVYSIPGKTVGYANFASVSAADEAIKTLHGARLCGIRIKVLEAEDKNAGNRKRKFNDEPCSITQTDLEVLENL